MNASEKYILGKITKYVGFDKSIESLIKNNLSIKFIFKTDNKITTQGTSLQRTLSITGKETMHELISHFIDNDIDARMIIFNKYCGETKELEIKIN